MTFPDRNIILPNMTLTAKEKLDGFNRTLAWANGRAIQKLLPARLGSVSVTITETDVVFSGGPHGSHSLALLVTDSARALAHWRGYAEQAGIGWAAPRLASTEMTCSQCDADIDRRSAMIATDFGDYCSAECAEQGYENYTEGQE